jgi:predicted glycosyltransferase
LKIWFDILTPKQVNFFTPVIDELKNRKHDVLCTSRKYREVEELAKIKGLELRIVGKYGGESLSDKLKASAERVLQLTNVITEFNPDTLVSLSSPEASRVAFGLAIPHLGFNDSPHAEAVCRLSVPFMSKLMCPWIIPTRDFISYGISKNNIQHYKALDPAIWLKGFKQIYKPKDFGLDSAKKTVTFRLEESKAAYYSRDSISSKLLSSLVKNFGNYNLVLLGRYPDQIESLKRDYSDRAVVIESVVDGTSLLALSDVFVGSGGTMNCEAALLGVPNISYAMNKIYVTHYLLRKGLTRECRNENQMLKLVNYMLSDNKFRKRLTTKANSMLSQMEDIKKRTVNLLESRSFQVN